MKRRSSTGLAQDAAVSMCTTDSPTNSIPRHFDNDESLYKAVFDNVLSEVHIWRLVRDSQKNIVTWRLIDANNLALKNWGKTLNEVKNKTTDEIFPGSDASKLFMPIIEKIFKEKIAYSWESYFPGTDQTLQMTTIPLDEIFISTGIDVSHIRRSERDLIRSQQRLELATEAAHVGIWEYDLETKTLIWDGSMHKIYGIPKLDSELTYSTWSNGVHPEDLDRTAHQLEQAINQESGFKSEFRIICQDTGKIKFILAEAIFKKGLENEHDRMIGVNIDITELKQAEQQIEKLAYFDTLTGLPNRFTINDRLNQAIANCGRTAAYSALIFIDIDDFKKINDSAGHIIGDELLSAFAGRLEENVRKADTFGRFGGDEFVIILNGLSDDHSTAQILAERFASKVQALVREPFFLSNGSQSVSASFGIALIDGNSVFNDVLRQADMAMYKAKGTGRNRIHFFDPLMQKEFQERIELENALRRAITSEEIETYYQLQINNDSSIRGAEVLARWRHPDKGYIPPDKFIGIAEEVGLIDKLGDLILKKACTDFKRHVEPRVPNDFVFSINVSAAQILSPDFVPSTLSILEQSDLKPNRIRIEITETVLLTSSETVSNRLQELRNKGFKFSLDDFGTGYSSLTMLKNLPIDEVKIDQSFVRDISSNPNSAAISKSIIALSQSMGIAVIAEGVEEERHRQLLLAMGCHAFQGYLFSKPLPLSDFLATLDSFKPPENCIQ